MLALCEDRQPTGKSWDAGVILHASTSVDTCGRELLVPIRPDQSPDPGEAACSLDRMKTRISTAQFKVTYPRSAPSA